MQRTQENLAEYLDVSVAYVSNIERGATKISLTTLSRVADYLGCDLSELVARASEESGERVQKTLDELIASLTGDEKSMLLRLLQAYKNGK